MSDTEKTSELSQDAKMVLAIFMPTLSRAGGNKLLRDINNAVPRHIKNDEFEKAKFALQLKDTLAPMVAKIPVQSREPVNRKIKKARAA